MKKTNLLTRPPECHRALFAWNNGIKSALKEFTVQDLLDYYALTFNSVTFYGNTLTVEQLAKLREAALKDAQEWEPKELEALLALVEKHGLEIVLYAIDLTEEQESPKVEIIKECIKDAELVLANLIRNRDYGV
jgi:hypothetical protein